MIADGFVSIGAQVVTGSMLPDSVSSCYFRNVEGGVGMSSPPRR